MGHDTSSVLTGLPVNEAAGSVDSGLGSARGAACEVGADGPPTHHLLDVRLHLPHRFPHCRSPDLRPTEQRECLAVSHFWLSCDT